jgi:hypothetical protein
MVGRQERRKGSRIRTLMTALVRPAHHRKPVLLRVVNLGPDGALCRSRVPLRLGAAFHAEFLFDGKCSFRRPRVIQVYCRVVWTAARIGPARPVQEIGLKFVGIGEDDRATLTSVLSSPAAA